MSFRLGVAALLLAAAVTGPARGTEVEEEVAQCRKACLRQCGVQFQGCLRAVAAPAPGQQADRPARQQAQCAKARAGCQKSCDTDCNT